MGGGIDGDWQKGVGGMAGRQKRVRDVGMYGGMAEGSDGRRNG